MTASTAPTILVAQGEGAVPRIAADLFVAWLGAAIGARGSAHVALTGGSSATGLYAALRDAERARAIDWTRLHAWIGDDRFVPLDHADSNGGLAIRELTDAGSGPLPRANLHVVPGGATPEEAAAAYAASIIGTVPLRHGVPAFDLVLLGIGGDGHLLSVFPGSAALADGSPLAMGIPAPTHITPHLPRVTLSPRILAAARHVMPMAAGAGKAAILARVIDGPADPAALPAQLALLPQATWVLDPAAAAALAPRA